MNPLAILLLFESVSGGELIVVLLAVFILFGPNKIPEIARGLAKGIRDIRNATSNIQEEMNKTFDPIKKEMQESISKIKDNLNMDNISEVKEITKDMNSDKNIALEENKNTKKNNNNLAG